MLSDVGEADALVSSRQSAPTGMQSMSVSTDFGYIHLSPVLGDFLAQHPDVSVNLELNNCYIGLISKVYDAVIRAGEAENSLLRVSKIAETTIRMVASTGYIQSAGRPLRIEDLGAHK